MKGRAWLYLAALRPFAYPASALSVLAGTAAEAPLPEWRWGALAALMAAVLLLHSTGNLLNDYFDYRSGVDHREEDDAGRPGRFLVTGILRPREYLGMAICCATLALPPAAYLVFRGGWTVALLGIVGLLGAYAYTGRPFALKYHALGEVCIFLVFGPAIMATAGYLQSGAFPHAALLTSIPVGMSIAAIASANYLRDHEEDAAGGIRTLAGVLGPSRYRYCFLALLFGPALLLAMAVALGVASPWLLLPLLALPAALTPARCAWRGVRRPDADALAARHMALFGALMALGLALAGGGRISP